MNSYEIGLVVAQQQNPSLVDGAGWLTLLAVGVICGFAYLGRG